MLRVVRLRTIAAACAALSGVTLAVAVAGMRSAAPPPGPPPAMPLWVDPDSQAARAARALAATRPDDAAALEWLARRPTASTSMLAIPVGNPPRQWRGALRASGVQACAESR